MNAQTVIVKNVYLKNQIKEIKDKFKKLVILINKNKIKLPDNIKCAIDNLILFWNKNNKIFKDFKNILYNYGLIS